MLEQKLEMLIEEEKIQAQRPLKILFLSHNFAPFIGGIEFISILLAKYFVEKGHKVRVLTWTKDLASTSFPFEVIRDPGLQKLLMAHKWADVVFENNPCLRLAWPNLLFKRPAVIGIQTWIARPNGKNSWQDRLKFRWLSRASRVVACSEAIQKKCWPAAKVIGNPFNNQLFKFQAEVYGQANFVFVGRLVSDKGVDLAIKAIHVLHNAEEHLNAHAGPFSLSIVGEGPERPELEKLVDDLGIQEFVKFKGSLQGRQLESCLREHRFMLVPSVWEEPFGVVALEGMACGCLPIVSDGGGLPEAVGQAGLTFKRGSVDSLVKSICHILSHPELEQQLRREAPGHLKKHNSKHVGQHYLEVIEAAAVIN